MASNKKDEKKYSLRDCIGLDWVKVPESPRDTCDFCNGPIFYDGHFEGKMLKRLGEGYRVMVACKRCASGAGLEW